MSYDREGAPNVLGHLCPKLALFLEEGGGCTPNINKEGRVSSCDGSNSVLIDFCPFCGIDLTPGVNQFVCPICSRVTRDSYYVQNEECEWDWNHPE